MLRRAVVKTVSVMRPRQAKMASAVPRTAIRMNSTDPVSPAQTSKLYVQHKIYKEKAALEARPTQPVFEQVGNYLQFKTSGLFMVALAWAQVNQPVRTYGWANKVQFAMKVEQLGVAKDWTIDDQPLMFQHKNKAGELVVLRLEAAGPASALLTVQQGTQSISIELTIGDLKVLQSLMAFSIPRLLGWECHFLQDA